LHIGGKVIKKWSTLFCENRDHMIWFNLLIHYTYLM
jgi:hypothetical protein